MLILRCYLPFALTSSHECMVEFSRANLMCEITMDWVQKPIWEPSCVLLSQTLKRFRDFPGDAWLGIHLPMQGTWVRALVWEDPTCCGETKPVHHNYWSPRALGPTYCNYWARVLQLLKPARLEPVLRNTRSQHNEKPTHCNEEYHLLAATRESPRAAMKTQHSQKIKNNKEI